MYQFLELILSPHMEEKHMQSEAETPAPTNTHTHTHTLQRIPLSVFWVPYSKGFREEDTGTNTLTHTEGMTALGG